MKMRLLSTILIFMLSPFCRASEFVECTDPYGTWKVNFSLDGKLVSDLEFTYLNELTARFPIMRAKVNHYRGKTYYDVIFDRTTYMDFNRVQGSKHLDGAFFIHQNPIGMEVNISCEAK